ncbi:hypothetical protein G6F58_013462 [Rhizopus delemar]|nr:hypothetical protein G6F58_013462 [Rhizopus delemar]
MNLLTRPELASDTPAHEDHHAHDHSHEQGGMKVFGMWVYLMSDLVLRPHRQGPVLAAVRDGRNLPAAGLQHHLRPGRAGNAPP